MNKTKLLNIIAWIFIVIGIILLIWRIFGGSPAEYNVLTALTIGLLFKVMAIGNDVTKLKISFRYLVGDFKDHIKHK